MEDSRNDGSTRHREKEDLLKGTKTKLGPCQVRSETDDFFPRPAVAKVRGIPFCEPCASEQEAYFAVGELAEAQALIADRARQAEDLSNRPLVEALDLVQRELAERVVEAGRRLKTIKLGVRHAWRTDHEGGAVVSLPRHLGNASARGRR